MPEDRTPIDRGMAHPAPERATIPQPKPSAEEDKRELVPNQQGAEENRQPGVGGHTDFVQQPD